MEPLLIPRALTETLRGSKKSVLLLGPRQTGKSTLIRALAPDLTLNLAHEPTYLAFLRNPHELSERLAAGTFRTVLVDEVQRLPILLNTIQALLDEPRRPPLKFYLTGSSARKLRRGHANLLPGRLHTYQLGPLTAAELGNRFDTTTALETGTLPGIWTEPDRRERSKTLRSYAATYLKEEIQAEALTRNIEGFSRFLFVVAAEAGKFLDLAKLAGAAQVSRQSAVRYFELLEDTLIVRRCDAFRRSERRRLIQHPRFFFFDPGVLNGLLNNFTASADRIGLLFEHLLFAQLVHSAAARDVELRISSYRTEHGAEVDFIVELGDQVVAIEAKASMNVGGADTRGLKRFADDYGKRHRAVIAYVGQTRKVIEGVEVLPWLTLLKELGF